MNTTNTIEAYHRQILKITKTKGDFAADNTFLKLAFLAIMEMEKTWKKRAFNWKSILNQFMMIGFQRKFCISALLASVVLFSAIAKVSFD
jgi:putative transposase